MSEQKPLLSLEISEEIAPSDMGKSQREQKKMIYKRRRLTLMFVLAFCLFTFMGINLFRNGQHLLSLQQNHTEVKKKVRKSEVREKGFRKRS